MNNVDELDNVVLFHNDGEFLSLPYMPWDVRPSHVPIDFEEAATALYLAEGVIEAAAEKLKCEPLRLTRAINRSPRLTRLHRELVALLNDKVHAEVLRAFSADDDRRREWASAKVINSAQFQSHPLAPNTAQSATVSSPGAGRIVISWESDTPVSDSMSSPLIEAERPDE